MRLTALFVIIIFSSCSFSGKEGEEGLIVDSLEADTVAMMEPHGMAGKTYMTDCPCLVNAFLMDLRIWDGTLEVDLLKSDGQILRGGFVIPGFVQKYPISKTMPCRPLNFQASFKRSMARWPP